MGNPLTLINHGFLLAAVNRFEEAIGFYDRALEIKPDDTEAHHNRALALLTLGRFEEGWLAYEYRNLRKKTSVARKYSKPLWWGDDPLKDFSAEASLPSVSKLSSKSGCHQQH
jgi:tetratricopeptide (TPR) repeat protein